jgi:hypothetical protein
VAVRGAGTNFGTHALMSSAAERADLERVQLRLLERHGGAVLRAVQRVRARHQGRRLPAAGGRPSHVSGAVYVRQMVPAQLSSLACVQCGYVPNFINYTRTVKAPIDFITTHLYPTDDQVPKVTIALTCLCPKLNVLCADAGRVFAGHQGDVSGGRGGGAAARHDRVQLRPRHR